MGPRNRQESAADVPVEIDTSKPHPARMYDYFLGGKNHFAAASHATLETLPGAAAATRAYQSAGVPMQLRDSASFGELAFSGLELVPPGVVVVSDWRPTDPAPRPAPAEVNVYGCVARKP